MPKLYSLSIGLFLFAVGCQYPARGEGNYQASVFRQKIRAGGKAEVERALKEHITAFDRAFAEHREFRDCISARQCKKTEENIDKVRSLIEKQNRIGEKLNSLAAALCLEHSGCKIAKMPKFHSMPIVNGGRSKRMQREGQKILIDYGHIKRDFALMAQNFDDPFPYERMTEAEQKEIIETLQFLIEQKNALAKKIDSLAQEECPRFCRISQLPAEIVIPDLFYGNLPEALK